MGRGVRGGLVDLQCLVSSTVIEDGLLNTLNARAALQLFEKWVFAANLPVLYKRQEININASKRGTADISGFGDVNLEITRKLGVINDNTLTLIVSFPLGASEAIREGIVLPQQLQLGSGVIGASAQFEHTRDFGDGLMLVGGSLSYGGWENDIEDFRASALSAYSFVGWFLGPLVPSLGFTVAAKFEPDRQRGEELDTPIGTATFNAALEWSSDYLAFLLSLAAPFTAQGPESLTISLGVQTSVF